MALRPMRQRKLEISGDWELDWKAAGEGAGIGRGKSGRTGGGASNRRRASCVPLAREEAVCRGAPVARCDVGIRRPPRHAEALSAYTLFPPGWNRCGIVTLAQCRLVVRSGRACSFSCSRARCMGAGQGRRMDRSCVRRSTSGRSRCALGGSPVAVQQLSPLFRTPLFLDARSRRVHLRHGRPAPPRPRSYNGRSERGGWDVESVGVDGRGRGADACGRVSDRVCGGGGLVA
ncbi:hypothetical protein C8R44DRAFT_165723 [Mycena epipterygia]|nr:hypothetical protein C8R44DRAFT_165723 [Mycena epipterygia]